MVQRNERFPKRPLVETTNLLCRWAQRYPNLDDFSHFEHLGIMEDVTHAVTASF